MAAQPCPVCGHTAGACTAPGGDKTNARQIITAGGVQAAGPLRMPRQRPRVGRAGYIGNVETFDPLYPNLPFVQEEEPAPMPDAFEGVSFDDADDARDGLREPTDAENAGLDRRHGVEREFAIPDELERVVNENAVKLDDWMTAARQIPHGEAPDPEKKPRRKKGDA